MTDKDIIKALEYCSEHGMCDDCPYQHKQYDCSDYLKTDAINLIKNQQAEIERLKEKYNCQQTVYTDLSRIIKEQVDELKSAKTEAYKEFADTLEKSILSQLGISAMEKSEAYYYCLDCIKNILQELTERKEDKNGSL